MIGNPQKVPFLYIYSSSLICLHILNRGNDSQGEEVIKSYTPTTLDSDVGHFELVIKVSLCRTSLWLINWNSLSFCPLIFGCPA